MGITRRQAVLLACGTLTVLAGAAPGNAAVRECMDLTGQGWMLWLDKQASWEDDELHLPPVEVDSLPSTPPTGGWEVLAGAGLPVRVPNTVEGYLWDTEGGDYKGVSWWRREFDVPAAATGKRLVLRFEAVRLRAEVFVNQMLVGYDVIGNTPFEVDVTDRVRAGRANTLAVRITDPGGNFDWMDFQAHRWGRHTIPASHGFGGITGAVRLLILDPVHVADVFVRNTPAVTDVELQITVRNTTKAAVRRDLAVRITAKDVPDTTIFEQAWPGMACDPGEAVVTRSISVPSARPWNLDAPQLYVCRVSLSGQGQKDTTFGFRWFGVDGIGTDARFRLNHRRIVLRSAISWGFWPINGITPTGELAEKQIRAARSLGLNMLNFHRCIAQPLLLDLADEMGLLCHEEPGGYTARGGDAFCRAWAREKLLRMVRRDRNHPSLAIYNMINEEQEPPTDGHRQDLADAHRADPSRVITYTSGWAGKGDDPIKLHLRPDDDRQYVQGWYDYHNAAGPGVYRDAFYNGPQDYSRYTDNRGEIVFWGEEGANATPPRLERIVRQLKGQPNGWDGAHYREWYEAYKQYLTEKSLWSWFPSIDVLTGSMGDVQYYYQGRIIENVRAGNVTDGYVINGWEAEKQENHSGVVDCFRNVKGDPQLLARYNAPLYVAVKVRNKVGAAPAATVADFYVVNEADLRGPGDLRVRLHDTDGRELWSKNISVQVTGGETYGELLAEGVQIDADAGPGRYTVRAELSTEGEVKATGDDDLFLVDWKNASVPANGAVLDRGGTIRTFLREGLGLEVPEFSTALERLDYVVIGQTDLEPRVAVPTEVLVPAEGEGTGLTGAYYKGADFHRRVLVRNDPTVDFDFRTDSPARAIGTTDYSVRWQGKLRAPESGVYQFHTESDDGVRLWIDDRRIIDHWSSHGPVVDSATPVELETGRAYKVRVEFFQRGGGAVVRLLWTLPSMTAEASGITRELVRRVRDEGTTVIVLAQADLWARMLANEKVVIYKGRMTHGRYWLGGNFFVREHPLFDGLPVNGAMNWEYQELINYDAERFGLFLEGEEAVVGSVSDHQPSVSTAVAVIAHGKGRFVLSTLDILRSLNGPPGPTDVARQLLCNYLTFARSTRR
ncbi:MAG: beta-galactosidase [bacterium]|nr:beta-galactosidase [bacterium]